MSDAFEQWAADKSFMLRVNDRDGYVGYVNVREMALEAWQAALQHSGEPVVDELCKALSDIAEWTDRYTAPNHPISVIAKKALLSAGKGGGE